MRASVDAMLEELDPYTIYIPEEENEDLQMMLSKTYGGIGAIIHKKKEDNVIINEPYAGLLIFLYRIYNFILNWHSSAHRNNI